MFNTKRKRAVVLALIAFFCGATAVVGVDWKRFGGGFLAFFKPKSEPVLAYTGGGTPSGGGILTASADSHPNAGAQPRLAAPATTHRRANGVGGGSGGHKSDDDLFKYGDPAAGGIPPGSFVVAQNDTPGGGNAGVGAPATVAGLSAPDTAVTAPSGDDAGGSGSGVTSPAPAPTGSTGSGDGGIIVKTPAPSPATPPAPPPVVSTPLPPAPAPTPTQSGTSDQDPGNGGGDTTPPVVVVTPPVSAVPEASNAAMMGLGGLFLAVAATRRRKTGQA